MSAFLGSLGSDRRHRQLPSHVGGAWEEDQDVMSMSPTHMLNVHICTVPRIYVVIKLALKLLLSSSKIKDALTRSLDYRRQRHQRGSPLNLLNRQSRYMTDHNEVMTCVRNGMIWSSHVTQKRRCKTPGGFVCICRWQ